MPVFFHCYDTALGCCGIAWRGQGAIVGSQLPEESAGATRDRMRVRFPTARESDQLPPAVQRAIAGVRRLLAGETADAGELLAVELDESGVPEFKRQVHALTRRIPVGQTLSYGELAARLGQPGAARAVGQAEGSNPFAPIVPCHRVMGSGGLGTGFSAHGGVETKLRLLRIEARAAGQPVGEQTGLFG
ncbi:methylated-DNA--[protein]-cysteine S-methyltransferase [Roseateles violae]|uniref:Methylated-DNA--[protein]-cysteine S-methyltransferase n=1 Tax=Roseateles violae TaxID=3058042 RepID=A0ABT8DQ88_9BURK|nr:methylated-DNA--[protein]-cysteine S-methyltransferase [Pelomonas sp. PFR6]MDN3920516.1 methylated-DNA--[protein]-cysteine S-methyltransferase [Pelomonas sp. PFR6]